MRRVVVSGIGLVTPVGVGRQETWAALREGRHGVRIIDLFDTSELPISYGAFLPQFRAGKFLKQRKNIKVMTRAVQIGKVAAVLAMEDAGLPDGPPDQERAGMFVGAGQAFGDSSMLSSALDHCRDRDGELDLVKYGSEGLRLIHPLWLLKGLSNNVLGLTTARYQLRGVNNNYCHSGVAGGQAIGEGFLSIRDGLADIVLAGGYDSVISPESLVGYGNLFMLADPEADPDTASRPFDRDSSGIVPGEGGAFLVLEEREHALGRGVHPIAEVKGYGLTSSVAGVTEIDDTGDMLCAALRQSIGDAEWEVGSIDLVECHGSGSRVFDPIELAALTRVFEGCDPGPLLTAVKSYVGHSLVASGAINAAMTCLALQTGEVLPIRNLRRPIASGPFRLAAEPPPGKILAKVLNTETASTESAGTGSLRKSTVKTQRCPKHALSVCAGLGGQFCALAIEGVD